MHAENVPVSCCRGVTVCWSQTFGENIMALTDSSGDPLLLSNGGNHPFSASGNAPSAISTEERSHLEPLSAACSCDLLPAERDGELAVRNGAVKLQQGAHVQRASRPVQNGGLVKLNGSLRNLPPSPAAFPSSAVTDSQKPNRLHLASTLSQTAPSALCCPHCHFHSTLCCPCGQPDCPLVRTPASPRPCSSPQPGSTSSCPCCLSTCTYSHHLPHHQASPMSLHHQRWQEHLQSQIHAPRISPARPFRFPKSYSELIADWPVVVLGVCTVLIVICALVGVLVPDLPDFSDPLLGFEPRGTAIGQRLVTWNNMVKNTGYKATLANYPFKYADEQAKSHQEPRWPDDHFERDKREVEWDFSKEFFCDIPGDSYSRLVFASAEGKSLWNIQAIKSMCSQDNTRVRSHRDYLNLCQRTNNVSCCPSWTLGNYIAVLTNKSSCQKITERDVSHTLKILRSCAKYYHNGTLGPDCWDMALRRKDQLKCASVPRKCTKYNAVYQILHFLVDKDFLSPKSVEHPPVLKYSMLFSPTEKGESMMNIYLDNFENWNSSDGITTVTGIEFGIKHDLFQDYLLTDTLYPAIAIVIVLLVMCVYTRSVFITLMTIIAIISSLIVSYFLYRMVFNFEFFPFMNLTALIILVGIGADDAFVLCDVWNYTKFDKPHAELSETSEDQDFTSCFIETFKQWMENQDCEETSVYPCCSQSTFPYKKDVFQLCIKRAIMELDRSTSYHLDSKTPGPRFDINDTIRAIVLEFQSTYLFTLAYEKMYQFYREVDAWITEELRFAPEGLSHGWFVSNLEFYDLQDSLSGGTLVAMALSVAVAFSVMLLTTRNVIISLYAILSIAGTIFVTVGSLVLLGWELNVLESVTISVAVGLSVDFAVHYGVAYRLAPEPGREGKVIFSLSRMGSAIAMAAVTTFVAGAMMMPSTVLAYTQLGTFMMLIMCISWAFATFFFQCMCCCLGPQGTCGQIPLPNKLQCQAFSEDAPSSPSPEGKYQLDSRGREAEHYELEPLASYQKTGVKPGEKEEAEEELGTRLCNGAPSHAKHTMSIPHIHGNDAGRKTRPENGLATSLTTPSRCHYTPNNCTCVDPPSQLLHQWAPHPCTLPPQDSPSCPPTPQLLHLSGNSRTKQNAALLPPNVDAVYSHMDCCVHYVHCPLTHFCSQGRAVGPRQGPAHTCHLRKYCVQPASNQDTGQASGSPNAPQTPDKETKHLSPDSTQNGSSLVPTRPNGPTAHCENQSTKESVHRCDKNPASAINTDSIPDNDDCRKIPGNQERPESCPVTREQSVKKCKQNSKRVQASSASPKRLYCFNRTLKVKCNSASEFSLPKSEASVPPVAVNSQPSSESLC
ncbi:protein dispatched homolog 1 isoform X3 [Poeciliopsis prolifica]|uniref:protein dispatched homolog 1 isoform X3 n=1 Tax=Poeciliopsis prolifica TaxID=188132 RepID=UPI0024133B25|nr:protein dispatched homolog 1 isoform X3 [Poeciliopsis prolifica]